MKNIHFIINPIAGSGKNLITIELLKHHFQSSLYNITVKQSLYKKNTSQLTKNSINEGAQIIVACGGDGTINEVASCLVNSNIVLGIIPTGSGNGLASNLNIPKEIFKAIALIKAYNIKQIDVGSINNMYFFSNTGIGFDARVIKYYEESGVRKLYSYIKASFKTLKELNYDNLVEIKINNKILTLRHFMVFVSNSNELGYKVSLTPKASLQDGLLDVIIISKLSKIKALLFGGLMLIKKLHIIKEGRPIQTKKIELKRLQGKNFNVQVDGEFYEYSNENISISIQEKALNVIA